MESGVALILNIFLLGAALGALLTCLHRRSLMSTVQREFRQELRSDVEQEASEWLQARSQMTAGLKPVVSESGIGNASGQRGGRS